MLIPCRLLAAHRPPVRCYYMLFRQGGAVRLLDVLLLPFFPRLRFCGIFERHFKSGKSSFCTLLCSALGSLDERWYGSAVLLLFFIAGARNAVICTGRWHSGRICQYGFEKMTIQGWMSLKRLPYFEVFCLKYCNLL